MQRHADSHPEIKLDGRTVKGIAIGPAVAGLERGGISRDAALTMLVRGQQGNLEMMGRAARNALWEIANDSSVDKSSRKTAAGMLLHIMENEMPLEDVAACLLLVGYPRERDIKKLESPKVDALLKNALLDETEDQEVRARAAMALRDRGFRNFGRPDDDACYFFFTSNYTRIPECGLAAVPFLLGRVKDGLSFDNKVMAIDILGEISDLSDEAYDWRPVVRALRAIAEDEDERGERKYLKQAAVNAYKRITGVYPSQDRNPSTTGSAD